MSLSDVADLSMSLATSLLFEEYRAGVWCLPAPEFTDSSKPDLFDPVVRTEPGWCSDHSARPSWSCGQGLATGRHPHAEPGEHADFGLGAMMGSVGPD